MAERRASASSARPAPSEPSRSSCSRASGYENVRVFASARSAGKQLGGCTVEEATPEALSRGDVDIFLFSVGTSASRELVPLAVAAARSRSTSRPRTGSTRDTRSSCPR